MKLQNILWAIVYSFSEDSGQNVSQTASINGESKKYFTEDSDN